MFVRGQRPASSPPRTVAGTTLSRREERPGVNSEPLLMPRVKWRWLFGGVIATAVLVSILLWSRGRVPGPEAPSPLSPPVSPGPTRAVPIDLPTTPPGLDRELAKDYQRALVAQGLRITALAVTDRRATGGARRADIVYRTAAGTLAAVRAELVRIVSPGANPKLALDQITVRATRADGTVLGTVTVSVTDLGRWLKAQMSDDEFYATWAVRGFSR